MIGEGWRDVGPAARYVEDPTGLRPVRRTDLAAPDAPVADVRSPLLRRVFRGLYAWSVTPDDDVEVLARCAAELLPETGAIGGWAAAFLLGAQGGTPQDPAIDLVVPGDRDLKPRLGIVPHRERLPADDVLLARGLPVTSPTRTAFDLLRRDSRTRAVGVVDAMLKAELVTVREIRERIERSGGWKGVPAARNNALHLDGRAASWWESALRLRWTDAGLPPPEVNVSVCDDRGRFLGVPDLLDLDAGLVGEFDGSGHREAAQHRADNEREERFERAGLVVVRFTAADLLAPNDAVERRIRAGRDEGLVRDRSRDRWCVHPALLQYSWSRTPRGPWPEPD